MILWREGDLAEMPVRGKRAVPADLGKFQRRIAPLVSDSDTDGQETQPLRAVRADYCPVPVSEGGSGSEEQQQQSQMYPDYLKRLHQVN